ncbi:MAG: D-alanyl-D-alanine carboxypeptidase family protein [Paracoccaceae bacterium]
MGMIVLMGAIHVAAAAPYAAYVMDARTGETLFSQNADTKLAPASLTKMMTLYITFQEIQAGHLSLDTMITVSKNAANQAPSRLGLKAGQKIALRYLIRAAAVKSANDAAAAIGDALAGSPEKWGARMTSTARQLGMKNSTFKNANGLPAKGHVSTARDMSILGRHLFYDFPQFYNIFSRRTTDAGMATVANTNRKFLDSYEGADGIKTGFTNAAGFNLTASAERNGVRIIATVLGGTSTPMRNQKMTDLLDLGFAKAKPGARTVKPAPADPEDTTMLVASADDSAVDESLPEVVDGAGKTLRVNMSMNTSPRPLGRPDKADTAATELAVAGMKDGIANAIAAAAAATIAPPPPNTLESQAAAMADVGGADGMPDAGTTDPAIIATLSASTVIVKASAPTQPLELAAMSETVRPPKRNAPIYTDSTAQMAEVAAQPEVVTRVSTSGGEHWGVNLGHYNTRSQAERLLLKIQLVESATLGDGLRKVVERAGGYDANFMGLSRDEADLACRRLQSRAVQCFTMGPA